MRRYRIVLSIVTVMVTLSIIIGCAEIVSPPGGEIDKTGPFILSTEPPNGSLNIPLESQITLLFSERIIKPDKEHSLFISPRPKNSPKIRWKGDKIEIEFIEPFNENQTYIISLGAGITDLRRNRLDSNTSIAFSTGDMIDSGQVTGQILKDMKAVSSVKVGLFNSADFDTATSVDSIYPIYLTTTDKYGNFELKYIPDGSYKLIGFQDRNHDDKINILSESYALPDRAITIANGIFSDTLLMSMTKFDTTTTAIASASYQEGGLIRIRMTTGIQLDYLKQEVNSLQLIDNNDSLKSFPILGILEADSSIGNRITTYFGNIPEGNYRIEMKPNAKDSIMTYDSLRVKAIDDRTAPTISSFLPGEKPVFAKDADISFAFSEPIDTMLINDQTFSLWQNDKFLPYTMQWIDPFKLSLIPAKKLSAGKNYRLDLTEFDIYDNAGKMLGDSLHSFTISILGDDSLGSVTGVVDVQIKEKQQDQIQLLFVETKSAQEYHLIVGANKPLSPTEDNNNNFSIELPPGKYILTGFIDSDKNGKMAPGSITPYENAETFAIYPDTVAVRARFETAGIDFIIK